MIVVTRKRCLNDIWLLDRWIGDRLHSLGVAHGDRDERRSYFFSRMGGRDAGNGWFRIRWDRFCCFLGLRGNKGSEQNPLDMDRSITCCFRLFGHRRGPNGSRLMPRFQTGSLPRNKSDEEFARGLLDSHLVESGASDFECTINRDEPPDLIVRWKQEKRWGVEVTRAYQPVQQIGNKGTASSEAVSAYLRNFGEDMGIKTGGIRGRSYTLYLEAPGPFSSWKRSVRTKQWKEETEEQIRRHISCGDSSILRFSGGNLRPGEPGERWSVMVGGPASEITSSTAEMLSRSLRDKAKKLPMWKGAFDQRWLLLLNCYILADDTAEIEGTVRRLVRDNADLAGFDGVLWSGFPDRALLGISLSRGAGDLGAQHRSD